ncbi:hypothetical protein [Alkalimonas sp.]|uniref:hypothetical protein n=1 Tax=Alkalimonas sp. TaxID=1872453 RepID=UPI00263AF848|nr:hypothetical protein [Alkalimonas sp.]MCC5826308.1 hypothetical protein [Alkalimonas sp.]
MKLLITTLALLALQSLLVFKLSTELVPASILQLWLLLPAVAAAGICIFLHLRYQLNKLFPLAALLIHLVALLPYIGLVNNPAEGERAILILAMVPLYQSLALLIVGLIDYVRRREANKRLAAQ